MEQDLRKLVIDKPQSGNASQNGGLRSLVVEKKKDTSTSNVQSGVSASDFIPGNSPSKSKEPNIPFVEETIPSKQPNVVDGFASQQEAKTGVAPQTFFYDETNPENLTASQETKTPPTSDVTIPDNIQIRIPTSQEWGALKEQNPLEAKKLVNDTRDALIEKAGVFQEFAEQEKEYQQSFGDIKTVGDYLNMRGIEPIDVGIAKDYNPDQKISRDKIERYNSILQRRYDKELLKQKEINDSYSYAGRLFEGYRKSVGLSMAPAIRDFITIGDLLDDAIYSTYQDPKSAKIAKDAIAKNQITSRNALDKLATYFEDASKDLPDVPDDFVGGVVGGIGGLTGLFTQLEMTPIGGGAKLMAQMSFSEAMRKYRESPDEQFSEKAKEAGIGAIEGLTTGAIFTGLGYGAQQLGKLTTLLTKSPATGVAAGVLGGGLGFGGYTAATGGNEKEILTSTALGSILALQGIGAQKKAMENYLSSTIGQEMAIPDNADLSKLRDKSLDLREQAASETTEREKILKTTAADLIDRAADIKAVSKEMLDNHQERINAIKNDRDIPIEEKTAIINRIKQTVNENNPKIQKAKVISEQLNDKDAEKKSIENDQTLDKNIKASMLSVKDGEIRDLKTSMDEIFSETEPKTAKGFIGDKSTVEIKLPGEKTTEVKPLKEGEQYESIKEGKIKEGGEPEYPKTKTRGVSESTGGGDSTEEGGKVEQITKEGGKYNIVQEEKSPEFVQSYAEYVSENVNDPEQIYKAYVEEGEKSPLNTLEPWQEFVLGQTTTKESYARFGDRNNITPAIKAKYLRATGLPIDEIARLASEPAEGMYKEVTPQMVVDFMTETPSVKKMNEKTNVIQGELAKKYRELTGRSITKHLENKAKGLLKPRDEVQKKFDSARQATKDFFGKYLIAKDAEDITPFGVSGKGISEKMIDAGFDAIELAYRAGKGVKEAVEKFIKDIKDSDWYRGLSEQEQKDSEDRLRGDIDNMLYEKDKEFRTSLKAKMNDAATIAKIKAEYKGSLPTAKVAHEQVYADILSGKLTPEQMFAIRDNIASGEKFDLYDAQVVGALDNFTKAIGNDLIDAQLDARDVGDENQVYNLQQEIDRNNDKAYQNDIAKQFIRSFFASTGHLLKEVYGEDFSYATTERDFDKANIKGRDISKQKQVAKESHKKIDENERKLKKQLEQDGTRQSLIEKKQISKFEKKQQRLKEISEKSKKKQEQILVEYNKAKEDFRREMGVASAGIPMNAVPSLLRMAAKQGELGIVKLDTIVQKLYEEVKDLNISKDDIRNLLLREGKQTKDEIREAKEGELKTSYEKELEKRIAVNQDKIDKLMAGEKLEAKIKKSPSTEKEKELFDINEQLKQQLKELRAKPKATPEEIRIKAKESRIYNETPRLKKQLDEIIKTGTYQKYQKLNTPISPEAAKILRENEKLRNNIKRAKREVDFKNQNWMQNSLFYAKKLLRWSLLSAPTSAIKITNAAVNRPISEVMDMLASETLAKAMPALWKSTPYKYPLGYKKSFATMGTAAKLSLGLRAEDNVSVQSFVKMTKYNFDNIVSILKVGKSINELEHPRSKESLEYQHYNQFLDFMQNIHKIIKDPIKSFGFFEELPRATQFALDKGMDITDPLTQEFIYEASRAYGERMILLQKNRVSKGIREGISLVGKAGGPVIGPGLEYLAYSEAPISTVPVNWFGENMERLLGLPSGVAEGVGHIMVPAAKAKLFGKEKITYGEALRQTIKEISEETDKSGNNIGMKKLDAIKRHLTYGTSSAVFLGTVAIVFHKQIKDFLDSLPRYLSHIPQIMTLSVLTNIAERHSEGEGIGESIYKGAGEEIIKEGKNLPLISSSLKNLGGLAMAIKNKDATDAVTTYAQNYLGEKLAAPLVPILVTQLSQWINPSTGYPDPHGFKELLLSKVAPGEVPTREENVVIRKFTQENVKKTKTSSDIINEQSEYDRNALYKYYKSYIIDKKDIRTATNEEIVALVAKMNNEKDAKENAIKEKYSKTIEKQTQEEIKKYRGIKYIQKKND